MRDIELRPRAQLDLESIYLHLAVTLSSPRIAERTIADLYASVERLAEFPTLGSVLKSDELIQPYRRMRAGRHWIYYTYDESTLTIWRVFHTSQDIDEYTYVDLM